MSFPRYECYKDSGVEWLGEVPEHWEISALKNQIRMRYGDALASEIREDGEIEVFGSNGPVGSHCVANTKAPAIVVGRKGSYGRIVWTERGGFVIDTAYAIDSDTTDLNLRWVYYGLQPLGLDSLSQDTGVPGLAREKAYEMRIAVPPHCEQQTIAAFLDRETAKIDALIAEQKRLIELLKEKRQSVISHAVTKGLNRDAPMKDSGIEWLGEVPDHWNVLIIKRFSTLQRGHDLTDAEQTDGPYPVVTSGGISGTHSLFKARGPGVVTGRYGSTGRLFYIEEDFWPHNTSLYVRNFHGNDPRFVWYSLQTIDFAAHSAKAAVPGIDRNDIHVLPVVVPPKNEQSVIAIFLDHENTKTDALIAEVKTAITLFQERRTALISAAVTGKIDVR